MINKIKIAIIGLGYVGTPLALSFAKHFDVIGYDVSKRRVLDLKNKKDTTKETNFKDFLLAKKINFTNNEKKLWDCNIFIVTVPTPVNTNKIPDLKHVLNASKLVGSYLKKNDIVVYESTGYPGMTEEACVPILEKTSSLIYKKNFNCGYSPERINPGDKKHKLEKISKIVSGSNKATVKILKYVYGKIIKSKIITTPSIMVAEAAKVIENTQRDLNIALINELSIIFSKLKIDTMDVIKAASTKWNFHKYSPGLVGGHCIGVDPYYLTFKSKQLGYNPKIILAGRKLNDSMAKYILSKIEFFLNKKKINKKKLKILVLGITFKENCPDTRNSQSFRLAGLIKKKYGKVYVYDSFANSENIIDKKIILVNKIKKNSYDVIILAVPHKEIVSLGIKKIKSYLKKNSVFLDLKGFFHKKYSDFRL